MKWLTVAILLYVFTSTAFAQTLEQPGCVEIIRGTVTRCESVFTPTVVAQSAGQEERDKIFSAWREIVRAAERHYKNKHGRYGNLAALRKAHLLRSLVFESCSSAGASSTATANFVPNSTLIDVSLTPDGQGFGVMILEHSGHCFGPPMYLMPDLNDSPDGLRFTG